MTKKSHSSDQVLEILESEIESWEKKYSEAEPDKKFMFGGAVAELKQLKESAECITVEFLRDRYTLIKNRKTETAFYELMNATKMRDEKRMEAITSVGKKINSLVDNA